MSKNKPTRHKIKAIMWQRVTIGSPPSNPDREWFVLALRDGSKDGVPHDVHWHRMVSPMSPHINLVVDRCLGRSSAPGGAALSGQTRRAPGPRSRRTAASPGWPRCSWGRARARLTSCAPPPSSPPGCWSPPPTASMTGSHPICLISIKSHNITSSQSLFLQISWHRLVREGGWQFHGEQRPQRADIPGMGPPKCQSTNLIDLICVFRSVSSSSTRSSFPWAAPGGTGGMTSRCCTSGPGAAGPSASTTMSPPPASHRRVSSWKGLTTS